MHIPRYLSLTEMLDKKSANNPHQPAFIYKEKAVTYREMYQGIQRFASFLCAQGLQKGDRVILALPNGNEFFIAFYGVLYAGGIAVPINHNSGPERIFSITDLSRADYTVVSSHLISKLKSERDLSHKKTNSLITVGHSTSSSIHINFPEINPNDVAFIQYTSGSTGNPKGVQLSHSNILTNIQQMIDGMRITQNDIFVSWLPAYHDMGLILMTMVPFYLGIKLFLMPTNIRSIRRWIETLQRTRATFTAAPDFGYRMALLYTRYPNRFHLANLRVALNAAEPVRTTTVEKFERIFDCKNVMMPAYGLAEATVGVSSWPPQTPIKVDERGFISVGKGFPGIEMKIFTDSQYAGPGIVGEILVKSPANTRGYFNNSDESSRLFWGKKYIRTGDLGYYDKDGDFYIVGRKKNIIIHGGQNISPHEVEEIIDELPFVRFSAAVGVDRGDIVGEQVYVFAEIKKVNSSTISNFADIAVEITNRFHMRFGFRPARVYLLKPHAIPRTSNGKIMHLRLKVSYLNRTLQSSGLVLFPSY